MPEKGLSFLQNQWMSRSGSLLHWRFGMLTALVCCCCLVLWTLDGGAIKDFLDTWRFQQEYPTFRAFISEDVLLGEGSPSSPPGGSAAGSSPGYVGSSNDVPVSSSNESSVDSRNASFVDSENASSVGLRLGDLQNASLVGSRLVDSANASLVGSLLGDSQNTSFVDSPNGSFNILAKGSYRKEGENRETSPPNWVSAELGPGYTSDLLMRLMAPGGERCRDSKTEAISIPGMDGKDVIELSTGDAHEFGFTALGPGNAPICLGGDYFEIDLSGDSWKSRPPVKDFGNGSYSTTLQVHHDFAGDYNLTVILLYRHFEGLRFSPIRFVYDHELRKIPVRFHESKARLPELQYCQGSDFSRDVWTGRWTRHERNNRCKISDDGRFRCLPHNLRCKRPWCDGTLASLESNGWVYSAHCSFRIFPAKTAWNCLKNRWIFFWGDSNHVDTIRNMLNFMLDLPEVEAVPRRFDLNFSNPKDPSQSVRITSIFNGHSNDTKNYEGLDSLKIEEYRILLKKYFAKDTVPDTIIMNSGLHDGVHWRGIKYFIKGADYAASFWSEVMESIRRRGLTPPKIIYRTTVATGGYARSLGFNPSKMEAFNYVVLDKFKEAGLLTGVIDDFDMTFPWHYDNRCNDGVHYGRRPAKMKWRDGEIGHQYFVDIMLAHILLNALCIR
ncbi:hypothetical protein MLD38_027358 [Melastoma candidum]|uniref:Uncharacterized protein n=1 Tax=Melastoma candidum TaxID=119954 RepID=A0ACB9P4R9_9MYRT|nr:hypothetical protein MLD38_027358 [Melastoma candidum]